MSAACIAILRNCSVMPGNHWVTVTLFDPIAAGL